MAFTDLGVSFSGNTINTNSTFFSVARPISEAFQAHNLIIVLYEYTSGPKSVAFSSLEAFDSNGKRIWTAETPTRESVDCYTEILKKIPLVAYSYCGYRCEIDLQTGKLTGFEFVK